MWGNQAFYCFMDKNNNVFILVLFISEEAVYTKTIEGRSDYNLSKKNRGSGRAVRPVQIRFTNRSINSNDKFYPKKVEQRKENIFK